MPFCRIKDITSVNKTFYISAKTKNSNFSRSNSNFSLLTPTFSRDGFYETCFQNPIENSGSAVRLVSVARHVTDCTARPGNHVFGSVSYMPRHLFKYSRKGLLTSFDGHVIEFNEVNKQHLLRAIDKVGLRSQPPFCFKCQVQNSELLAFYLHD